MSWLKENWFKVGILLGVLFIGYSIMNSSFQEDWTLSLYGGGETIMRLEYPTKESCLSAGNLFSSEESIERFDCGLSCTKATSLLDSPLCKQVCDIGGCRN